MMEVWKEICQGVDVRIPLVALLSIAFICVMALSFFNSLHREERDQSFSIITPPIVNPHKETLHSEREKH